VNGASGWLLALQAARCPLTPRAARAPWRPEGVTLQRSWTLFASTSSSSQ